MSSISFRSVCRTFPGHDSPVVDKLDLDIADGEFMVLVGPSGCGKTTSLRMLAGLEEVSDGAIYIGDQDVTDIAPKDRDIAMVFQNYALYPHMSVRDNMGFALKLSGVDARRRNELVEGAAELLELTPLLDRKPKALSGGQRQRVAMGRAIVREPRAFLMDEPLSNLDARLRVSTRTQIAALQHRLGVTTVYVTHDQVEAMTMGDRVAVLNDGRLQQVDTPLAIYEHPANVFVAGFIGSPGMNLITTSATDGQAEFGQSTLPLNRSAAAKATSGILTLGIRPEDLHLVPEGEGLPIDIDLVEDLGSTSFVYASTLPENGAETTKIVMRVPSRSGMRAGQRIAVSAPSASITVFDVATGDRLPN